MIQAHLTNSAAAQKDLKRFLAYVTEKMCGERSDSHDTATLAYVVVRNVRENLLKAPDAAECGVWASNEGARAACRELGMYLGYLSDQQDLTHGYAVRRLRDYYDQAIKRQDGEKWARERDKQAKGRPTVREARRA